MKLADRARRMAPSATMAVDAKAKELQRAGVDVISFGAGEPDFPTPAHVKGAATKAIDANFTKYAPVAGIADLREAVARRLQEDEGLSYRPEQIIIGNGAKEICYNICQVLLQSGDEAVIPAPYWVSYSEQVLLADATPVIVPTAEESAFKISPAALDEAITERTRLLILNSPNNPTGSVYSVEELRALGEVLRCHPGVTVLSDEIYKKIAYDEAGRAPSVAATLGDLAEQIVLVDGASKAYSMTGWRIGFAAGPREVIGAMTNLQSHSTSGAASVSQKAALEAFSGDQSEVERMRREFQRRRDCIVAALNAIPGVRCLTPGGAFYAFPNVQGLLGRTYQGHQVSTTLDLVAYLLDEAHVAVVPGEAFGAPGYLRLSYATSQDLIEEGVRRMSAALAGATREAVTAP